MFSRSAMSNSLRPHGVQHTSLPCPSPSPGHCSNSYPLSQWCHPTISSSHLLLPLPSIFPSIRVFSSESALLIRWPKYWTFTFSINPFNEYSGLIFFRIDWFDIFAVQGTLKNLLQYQFKSINFLVLMVRYHHWHNGHEFEQTPGDSGGQRSLACCSPWDCKELDTT